MSVKNVFIVTGFFLFALGTTLFGGDEKIYGLQKAMVLYNISGGGKVGEDLNLSIEGEGKRRFKSWGSVELIEKEVTEKTVGVLHYTNTKHICKKRAGQEVLNVDFKNKKIMQRPISLRRVGGSATEGLVLKGQQMVADVVCDMWVGKGIRKCLYKGIPILVSYEALGFTYREEATRILFDINISNAQACSVPSYPVQKFALVTNSFKTRQRYRSLTFSDRLLEVVSLLERRGVDAASLSPHEQNRLRQMILKPALEEQKERFLQLLESMKKTRFCLAGAHDTDTANRCIAGISHMKSYFTEDRQNRIDDWQKSRRQVLEAFDRHIDLLQSKMKCIRASRVFSDLAKCMKE